MKNNKRYWLGFGLLVIIIFMLAWAPWVKADFIGQHLVARSDWENKYQEASEPCSFKKIISTEKVLFGARVVASYMCFLPQPKTELIKFVSAFGTVHNLRSVEY